MKPYAFLLFVSLAACGTPEAPAELGTTPDADPDAATSTNGADADAPDLGPGEDDGTIEPSDMGTSDPCAALDAAACMADLACTLGDQGCRETNSQDEAFQYMQTQTWVGTAESSGDKDFPVGEIEAVLSIFRSNARDVRGVLHLPALNVRHSVWGGVGPTGRLGLYLSTPSDLPFETGYEAAGLVTDLDLTLSDIEATDVVDFRTAVSLRMTPSDGFKPVVPIYRRPDPVAARWIGDFTAVSEDGTLLSLYCEIDINPNQVASEGVYTIPGVNCTETERSLDTSNDVTSADAPSIAWANGNAWLALGPNDDDLMFVGRVGEEGPWEGVVARRGDVWTAGDPIDPADVPVEALRGTFTFYPLQN